MDLRPTPHRPGAGLLPGTLLLVLSALGAAPSAQEPRARALSRALTAAPRLAGTADSLRAGHRVARWLAAAGFEVELDAREVLLSHPRRLEVQGWREIAAGGTRTLFHRVERFDVEARPPGDVPRYNAWSASGRVEGPVVDVGRGLRADYERLAEAGVPVAGRIALARYGGSYRGVKAELAQAFGCAGLLLFNDPSEDGPERGAVWPQGPFKPPHAAQRGSISSLARVPGDPSTPGWASPSSGSDAPRPRLGGAELAGRLPAIPVLPIGSDEAQALIDAGDSARARLHLDVPRTVRTILNVVGTLPGETEDYVLAGNHRDAWVRGAQDAGSGTVSLLLAAERLGARAATGWRPASTIRLAFWDAEEFGLIGSTEWGEAHAEELRSRGLAYVNADAVVSGLSLRVAGTPGLEGVLERALARVPMPGSTGGERTLLEDWRGEDGASPQLGLPGSGSDYTVFLHHLGIPVLDVSFGGNPGGQYHTAYDDFPMMDRFLDPTWEGHALAGHLLAELLTALAEEGRAGFDDEAAARRMAEVAREAGDEALPAGEAAVLAAAFESLATAIAAAPGPAPEPFYRFLERPGGLADRPWYRNELWAPGLETGYAAESLPGLRLALARGGEEALREELARLVERVGALEARWRARAGGTETPAASRDDGTDETR